MALVDDDKHVFREEIEQAVGTLARLAAVEIARIVLDARAVAKLLYHLHVVLHALLYALRPQRVAHLLIVCDALAEVVLNLAYCDVGLLFRGDEDVGRKNLILGEAVKTLQRDSVKLFDALYRVAPHRDAQDALAVCHRDVYGVAFHAETAAFERHVVASVEGFDKTAQQLVAVDVCVAAQRDDRTFHRRRAAHAVDARHGSHHDDVAAPGEQRRHGGETQAVDVFVDGKVLLDICV